MDTKTLAISIGAAFRAARERRALTIEQAAELLRLQPDFYRRIEAGDSLPTILTAARAAEALGVDPLALFGAAYASDADPRFLAASAEHDRKQAQFYQKVAHDDRLARLAMERKLSDAHREFAEARAAYESTIEGLSGRLESLAVECEALVRELVAARDRIDALEAEREALRLLAELRDEDPDVTECRYCAACVRCPVHDENPDQLRLSLGTGHTPAGPIIAAGVQR